MNAPIAAVTAAIEPQRIYNVLFRGTIPRVLETRFGEAWQLLSGEYTPREHAQFQAALGKTADLEALELVCRRRGRLEMLVDQVALMAALAETLPELRSYYIPDDTWPLLRALLLPVSLLRTAWKYAKGHLILKRLHGS